MKTIFCSFFGALLFGNLLFATGYNQINHPSKENLSITVSNYADFLNAVAATDQYQLYDKRMELEASTASLLRRGKPGSYHYEAIEGKENCTVSYLTLFDTICYLGWLQHDFESTAQTYFLNEEKIHAFRKNDDSFTPWNITACYLSLDPQLKSNQIEFQIQNATQEKILKNSSIAGDNSLGEMLEEGALAILALAEAGRERAPEIREEGVERMIPLEERQVEALEEMEPAIEAPREVLDIAPRKPSLEVRRRVFQIFFEHYLYPLKEKADALLLRTTMSDSDRGFINSAKNRMLEAIKTFQENPSHVVNFRMLIVIDQCLRALHVSTKSINCSERSVERYREEAKAATNTATLFIQSSEYFKKFLEAKAAGQSELARALAHVTVYSEKRAMKLMQGKLSGNLEQIVQELTRTEEKFAKADKKIAEYQNQEGDSWNTQKVMGMEFRYNELIVELARKYKQALAAANLHEAASRWGAIKAVEKSLEYRRKATEKDNEAADLLMEIYGYYGEAAEMFAFAQKNFIAKMGTEFFKGILMNETAKELERAIAYREKADQYSTEARGIKKQMAAIKNWASLQYQKAIQPKVVDTRDKFLRALNRDPLSYNYSLYSAESDYNSSYYENLDDLTEIEDVHDAFQQELSKQKKEILPYFQKAIRYHQEAAKLDSNMSEEERSYWSEAADRINQIIDNFCNTNAAGRKKALKAIRKVAQLEQRALALRSKNSTRTNSTHQSTIAH